MHLNIGIEHLQANAKYDSLINLFEIGDQIGYEFQQKYFEYKKKDDEYRLLLNNYNSSESLAFRVGQEGLLSTIWDHIVKFFEWLIDLISRFFHWLGELISKIVDWVKDTLSKIFKSSGSGSSSPSTSPPVPANAKKPTGQVPKVDDDDFNSQMPESIRNVISSEALGDDGSRPVRISDVVPNTFNKDGKTGYLLPFDYIATGTTSQAVFNAIKDLDHCMGIEQAKQGFTVVFKKGSEFIATTYVKDPVPLFLIDKDRLISGAKNAGNILTMGSGMLRTTEDAIARLNSILSQQGKPLIKNGLDSFSVEKAVEYIKKTGSIVYADNAFSAVSLIKKDRNGNKINLRSQIVDQLKQMDEAKKSADKATMLQYVREVNSDISDILKIRIDITQYTKKILSRGAVLLKIMEKTAESNGARLGKRFSKVYPIDSGISRDIKKLFDYYEVNKALIKSRIINYKEIRDKLVYQINSQTHLTLNNIILGNYEGGKNNAASQSSHIAVNTGLIYKIAHDKDDVLEWLGKKRTALYEIAKTAGPDTLFVDLMLHEFKHSYDLENYEMKKNTLALARKESQLASDYDKYGGTKREYSADAAANAILTDFTRLPEAQRCVAWLKKLYEQMIADLSGYGY